MNATEIDNFEKIQAQLANLYQEISTMSKKNQNDALNKFKLKFINQIIHESNLILGDNYKPFSDFEVFDENDIPTNSDVAMMLTQYLSCFEKLHADNVIYFQGSYYWTEDSGESNIKTHRPRRFV